MSSAYLQTDTVVSAALFLRRILKTLYDGSKMGSTKEIWLSEGGGVNTASDWGCLKIWGWLWCFCRIWDGMVEANIRVHRWILISRVRDMDAAEARFVFC